jgi:proteasome lid subunit RPN8/RPN11
MTHARERLRIRSSVLASMLASGRASSPYEIAGLLAADAAGTIVESIELCRGTCDAVRVPADLSARAASHLARRGLIRAGTFHSHPRTPAYPTRTDRAHLRAGEVMLIVDVAREQLRAFRRGAAANRVIELALLPDEAS